MTNKTQMEIVYKNVCQECGASYSTSNSGYLKGRHTELTGHNTWRRVKTEREKEPMKIMWNLCNPHTTDGRE